MEYIQIGKLGKPYGLKGDVKVLLWDKFVDFIPKKLLFVEQKGDTIPFFIASCQKKGVHLLVRFEDFDNPNTAYQVAQKKIYLRAQDLPKAYLEEEVSDFDWLIGLRLKEENGNDIGVIENFDEAGPQIVVLVSHKGQTFMVPWVDNFIVTLDVDKGFAVMDLPDGMIPV